MTTAAPRDTVAVIGGGFAGLAAATALAAEGVRVHLFEARPTLGGRAATFRDPHTGERIDNGQHVLAGCYDETLAFLARIGAGHLLHRPSALRVPMVLEDGRRTELALPALPPPLDLVGGVLAWDALPLADRLSILRVGAALRRPGAPHVETVREWLARHRQPARVCELLWEPLALAALNQSIDDADAESFVAVTSRLFGPTPGASALLLPAVPLDELYVQPSVAYLESRGAAVHVQAKATVTCEGNAVRAVQTPQGITPVTAVICSAPWHAVRDVFPQPPDVLRPALTHAAAMASAPIVTVNLWWDVEAIEAPMLGLPGRTFQWAFDRRRLIGAGHTHVSLVSSGAEAICAMANDALVRIAKEELRAALPALRHAALRHASVVRERRATFSLKAGSPPRPATRTGVTGLFLAGDWIDTGLPATIESAVVSGHRAAAALLAGEYSSDAFV